VEPPSGAVPSTSTAALPLLRHCFEHCYQPAFLWDFIDTLLPVYI
jgi:hypothetical protein